jgi:hypothetical protein
MNHYNISSGNISIRRATEIDIPFCVDLSHDKRIAYEKVQPQFWKYAGPSAESSQNQWFIELLKLEDYIVLVAEQDLDQGDKIVGFVIGRLVPAPEVYNPGGLTLMIDDFCVAQEDLWGSVGKRLIDEIRVISVSKGAAQIYMVSGAHDIKKRNFIQNIGLTIASEWYVGNIK